jgi:hypothetical protein
MVAVRWTLFLLLGLQLADQLAKAFSLTPRNLWRGEMQRPRGDGPRILKYSTSKVSAVLKQTLFSYFTDDFILAVGRKSKSFWLCEYAGW